MKLKKALYIAAACVLAAGMFFGCSKKEAAAAKDPNAPAKLTVWCWDPAFNMYAMEEAAKIYKTTNPNVTVEIVETPWDDLQQKLITSLTAGATDTLPDIILMQDNAAEKNISAYPKAFLPLDGKIDLSQFASYKVDFGKVNGKCYTLPFDNGATATFLRTDTLAEAGLTPADFNDITWDRFIELGRIVKAKTGKPLVSMPQDSADFIAIMMQSAGTWYFDANGKTNIVNNKALHECMRIYSQMIAEGICLAATDWNAYIATIQTGAVAGTINGCWIIGSITAVPEQSGKWAAVNTPRIASMPESVNYSSNGGSSWMVLASSKNADIAVDFLNKTFAGSTELYDTILPKSGAIGTWLPAGSSPVYSKPQDFFAGQKVFEDIVGYAAKIPRVKYGIYNYEARDAISIALYDILAGKDITEALKSAQETVMFQIGE